MTIKGKFSSKFSELWTNVQGQSCHHVHVSSCQPHHHVNHLGRVTVRKACEFTGENALGRETLRFFWYSGSWGRRSKVSVSAVPGLDLGKLPTKSAQDSGESLIFAAKCAPVCGESSIAHKNVKNWRDQHGLKKSALLTLRECWPIWLDAPAMRVCNRLWQNALARLRAVKHEWCCDAPGKRDCSWRLLNSCAKMRER